MSKKIPSKPFHEVVAERLIEQLEQGTAPWQIPWTPGKSHQTLPFNPSNGKRYKGINTLNLMAQGYQDPRWMTYKQAKSLNAQVIKGEKSTSVQYWKFTEEQKILDNNGKPVLDPKGKELTETIQLERPKVFFASVFNAQQIDGLQEIEIKPINEEQTWLSIERVEKILASSQARIKHKSQNNAFYSPGTDSITLPEKTQFKDASTYYATALHELGHWTGHPSRLNRDLSHPFGSTGYAKEELRAEISSMILGEEIGIGHDPEQHTAYVKSWIKALKDDPMEIFRAAADAEKIQSLVLSYEQKQVQSLPQNLETEQNEETSQTQSAKTEYQAMDIPQTKIYFDVPFKEKEEAKNQGLKWDRQAQHWYGFDADLHKIEGQWPIVQVESKLDNKIFIAVPYDEKEQAKAIGAKWSKPNSSWYVERDIDKSTYQKWLPENRKTEQLPAIVPREALAKEMQSMGFDVTGDHPIMDGEKHRCRLSSDKASVTDNNGSGMYVAFMDGIPAAYISNNRTGESRNWSSKGYTMNESEKAELHATAAKKRQERDQAQAAERLEVSLGIKTLLEVCNKPTGDETYFQTKQTGVGDLLIVPTPDRLKDTSKVMIGSTWQESKLLRENNPNHIVFTTGDILVPGCDANGNIWTAQTIQPNGTKMFPKGSLKTGTFHVVGGSLDDLSKAPIIIVAEGYSTSDTISEAAGQPVVSAFDAGNLVEVAKSLRELHPTKPMLICGDNDLHQMMTEGKNTGHDKATKAAETVNGITLFPIFAPKEQYYPTELPIVTPELWRNKEVLAEQIKAIDKMKKYTDFNDIKTKSALGMDGVKRQVSHACNELINNQSLKIVNKEKLDKKQTKQATNLQQRTLSRPKSSV
ncbi:zincin-like metallopeptidase domain-containing protein [Shewanella frigidimarina]|uniref:zincin-like metallopeptidase domain-containing protein n=1 Tax=Shewanella frigidimarina TaxID=56812 RepID=UPI003D7C0BF9